MAKKKRNQLKTARAKAWKAFSKYIRYRDDGQCFTCPVKKHPSEMHAGHFEHLGTTKLWLISELDEININCQCVGCNTFNGGRLYDYGKKLESIHGDDIVKRLRHEKEKMHKHSTKELEAYEQYYKERTKNYT